MDASARDAVRFQDQASSPLKPASTGRVSVSDDAYVPAESIRAAHGMTLPARVQRISVYETKAQTLREIARTLSRRTGIPVMISPDLDEPTGASTAAAPPSAAPQVSQTGVNQAITRLGLNVDARQGEAAGDLSNIEDGRIVPPAETAATMSLHWDGLFTELLDQICAKFGATYTYNGTSLLISHNITRIYTIHALAANLSLSNDLTGSGINGGSSGGGGGASNGAASTTTQSVKSSVAIKVWDDILAGVNSIVGKTGSVAALLSTGTLTVTAPPPVIDQVQEYVDQHNRALENEITVTVQVLNVTLNNSDTDSFNLSALLSTRGVRALLGNQTPATTGSTTTANTSGTISPGVSIVSGGTTAALSAISQLGRVSTKTASSVTTMNGYVAPFQITNTRSYVASESVTNTGSSVAGTQTQTALVPGTVTTGYNIAVLPRVDFADGTVLLQYGVSISALAGAVNGFDVFTTPDGSASIQLANVNQNAFINTAEVPDGDTIVVTGYEQDQDTSNKTGFGTAGFYGLSGNQAGTHSRTISVILITPTVQHVAHNAIQTAQE